MADTSSLLLLSQGEDFFPAFVNSLFMIVATEIGDKTFFIAAVLAMRNSRLAVYSGAMAALFVMHVLSSLMGYALPNLIPKKYTHIASIFLFIYFGLKLLNDSKSMSSDGPSEELQEVEEELENKKYDKSQEDDTEDIESNFKSTNSTSTPSAPSPNLKKQGNSFFSYQDFKIFSQALTLTFLAEWGDRSQITTIALASSRDPFGVILGGLLGHAMCTGLAVLGGRMLAARISEKMVAVSGGILFLFFALTSFLWGV